MLRSICFSFVAALLVVACSKSADQATPANQEPAPSATAAGAEVGKEGVCEHGVAKALCARCNPKLAPAYKAKGDWCPEHDRPESQCVICNPELAQKGVK